MIFLLQRSHSTGLLNYWSELSAVGLRTSLILPHLLKKIGIMLLTISCYCFVEWLPWYSKLYLLNLVGSYTSLFSLNLVISLHSGWLHQWLAFLCMNHGTCHIKAAHQLDSVGILIRIMHAMLCKPNYLSELISRVQWNIQCRCLVLHFLVLNLICMYPHYSARQIFLRDISHRFC